MIPCSAAACVCEPVQQRADLGPEGALAAALTGTALALGVESIPGRSSGAEVGTAVLTGGSAACPQPEVDLTAAPDAGAILGNALAAAAHGTAQAGLPSKTALSAGPAPGVLKPAVPVHPVD